MKRLVGLIAALVFAVAVLAGCSSNGLVSGSQIVIAQFGNLDSINPDVSKIGNEHNANELANLTTSSFYNIDANGELVANDLLGTVEVVTKNPLVVKYTLADGVKWSDGTPIDSADLALSLAAGTSLGGIYFQSVRVGTGVSAANLDGEVKSGNSITVKFDRPVADYMSAVTLSVPAHVIAKVMNSTLSDAAKGKQFIRDVINKQKSQEIQALADAYRNAFTVDALKNSASLEELSVSSGPYRVEKLSTSGEVTLVANSGYALGPATKVERVQLEYFVDATAAVAAMVAGTVDISGAEDSGLVSLGELKKLSETGTSKILSALEGGALSEQVLLNFAQGSVFSDQSRDAKTALALRKAFLFAVPKQRILIQTAARYTTSTSNSFVFDAASDYYQTTEHDNGSADYLIQDLEKSVELLDDANVRTPIDVRVVFDTDNPRAQSEWLLLQDRALQAGFNLINISSPDPSRTIARGEFDIFIGPRLLMSAPNSDIFQLSGNSLTAFRSEKVDALLTKYAVAEGLAKKKLLKDIDIELFKSGFGLPLYEVPSMIFYSQRVAGFVPSPHCQSATWGYYNWSVPAPEASAK